MIIKINFSTGSYRLLQCAKKDAAEIKKLIGDAREAWVEGAFNKDLIKTEAKVIEDYLECCGPNCKWINTVEEINF